MSVIVREVLDGEDIGKFLVPDELEAKKLIIGCFLEHWLDGERGYEDLDNQVNVIRNALRCLDFEEALTVVRDLAREALIPSTWFYDSVDGETRDGGAYLDEIVRRIEERK